MKKTLALGLLCIGPLALAGPSGLNAIPTADLLKHREIVIDYCVSGTEQNVDKRYYHANAVTVGLLDRLEIGYDNDFADSTSFHAKLLLVEDDKRLPGVALSIGAMNVVGRASDPYVAARYDFKAARAHAGWWRCGGVDQAFVGIDFAVLGDATAMAEHIAGKNGYTWAGLCVPISGLPGLTCTVGVGVPNTRSDGVQHYGLLEYGFRL